MTGHSVALVYLCLCFSEFIAHARTRDCQSGVVLLGCLISFKLVVELAEADEFFFRTVLEVWSKLFDLR